jgi:hypothetical protein
VESFLNVNNHMLKTIFSVSRIQDNPDIEFENPWA